MTGFKARSLGLKGLGVAMLLAALPALAAGTVTDTSAPAASTAVEDTIALAPGDQLKIVVYDRPELTGAYTVGTDGAIRMPMAGALSVAGTSLAHVERTLTARISALLDYDVAVIVDMERYRPIFVVGAVEVPGEHSFTPGLRVMQAVGRAGGVAAPGNDRAISPLEIARARQKLGAARLEVQALAVRLAALDVSIAGGERLSPPDQATDEAWLAALRDVARDQQALITADRESLAAARALTERQQAQLDEEIRALLEEEAALREQAALVEREVASMQSLRNQGLTTSSRMLSLRQMDADVKADLHRQAAYLSRARQEKIRLEQKSRTLEDDWRRDYLEERAAVATDLAQARADLRAARETLLLLGFAPLSGSADEVPMPHVSYRISRMTGAALETLPAEPATALLPGDVLHVDIQPAAPSANTMAQGSGTDRPGPAAASASEAVPLRR